VQRRAEPGDAVEIAEIERHQGGSSAVVADRVVEFFEAGLRARHRHHMRAGLCKCARSGIADTARGAGDQSNAGGEGEGHGSKLYRRPCERRDTYAVTAMRRKVVGIKWR